MRAVARRAGVSHAAPKNHFQDRAGLLSALAADGFTRLAGALRAAVATIDEHTEQLAALGRAYLDFGLTHPDLFELMFRIDQLHPDAPDLRAARDQAFTVLRSAITAAALEQDLGIHQDPGPLSLIAWAFVHGLVHLTHSGALQQATAIADPQAACDLAHTLTSTFTNALRPQPAAEPP